MKIIRGKLDAAQVSNPSIRYNPDTDQIEMSPDGGTTWNPAPGSDPRHSLAFLRPPVAGSSKQCDAAANMTKWLHDFIDQMLFDFELVGTVTTIINSILLSLNELTAGYATFLELISELAETISTAGAVALAAAFTSTEYDLLTCIFYCNVDVNGRVDANGLSIIQSEITAQLNTTAALITNAILSIQGEIGLSNAGAIGGQTGDCSGCASCDWCHVWGAGFTNLNNWTNLFSGGSGVYVDPIWTGQGGSGAESISIHTVTPSVITVDVITVTYSNHDNNGERPGCILRLAGTQVARIDSANAEHSVQDGATETFTFAGVSCDEIQVFNIADGDGTLCTITQITGSGTGAPGFGSNNCP